MIALRAIYIANILVAGWIGISCLFSPQTASLTVFTQAYAPTEAMRLIGCLWLGIAFLSILGMWQPLTFAPVLLMQLFYKGTWLLAVCLPAWRQGLPFPKAMAGFFLVWVLILPLVIPWQSWLRG